MDPLVEIAKLCPPEILGKLSLRTQIELAKQFLLDSKDNRHLLAILLETVDINRPYGFVRLYDDESGNEDEDDEDLEIFPPKCFDGEDNFEIITQTFMEKAVEMGHNDVIEFLFQQGAAITEKALRWATRPSTQDSLILFLNSKTQFSQATLSKAIGDAIGIQNFDAVKRLVLAGVNLVDNNKILNALSSASNASYVEGYSTLFEIVRFLFDSGMDVRDKDLTLKQMPSHKLTQLFFDRKARSINNQTVEKYQNDLDAINKLSITFGHQVEFNEGGELYYQVDDRYVRVGKWYNGKITLFPQPGTKQMKRPSRSRSPSRF